MGCYVNPRDMSKEVWLMKNGTQMNSIDAKTTFATESHVPVCLVNNGPFFAAGVAFDKREQEVFLDEDGRDKYWYLVERSKLYEVSDLKSWER